MNELSIKLKDVSVSFGNKDIFNIGEISAYINDRIAIVGRNGTGKSTLLKIIAGTFTEYSGEIQRETDFNYLPQIDELNQAVDNTLDFELLSRLNVPDNDNLSGGEETKFRLVQTLSIYKLGLLLDEPTTHLDQKSIEMLISELEYYYGTLIFVSHDRQFINRLATKIWEIDNAGITEYTGNYDDYETAKQKEKLENERQHQNVENEKKRLQAAMDKQTEKAEKMTNANKQKSKDIKPNRLAGTRQKDTVQKQAFKTAKAIGSRMEQLKETDLPQIESDVEFPLSKAVEMHNKFPIMGNDITVIRGDKTLLNKVSFQFPLGETIAITGNNGTGKSSLLTDIELKTTGITMSPKVKMEKYKQMDYKLYGEESIVQFLMRHTEMQESIVRSMLVSLGFSQDESMKAIGKLSGGEATRVSLALMFVKPSNVIVMDEPTNFIDLKTIEALEKFILAYKGTILFTSHDKYFVERTADQIYKIEDKKLQRIK